MTTQIGATDSPGDRRQTVARAVDLLRPGGIYVIDDMLPQPNWPDGHAEKVQDLVSRLERMDDLILTKMCWSSGLVVAAKRRAGAE